MIKKKHSKMIKVKLKLKIIFIPTLSSEWVPTQARSGTLGVTPGSE